MVRSSCHSSTGTTITGAICRCWALSVSMRKPNSICARRCCAPAMSPPRWVQWGCAHPAVLEFLDAQPKLEYVVAMAKNAVLKRVAAPGIRRARQLSRSSGKTEHIYGEVRYAARKWPALRRVVIKAEVVGAPAKDPKDHPRFVITNMKQSPQWIYEQVYCRRGDIENRIKE